MSDMKCYPVEIGMVVTAVHAYVYLSQNKIGEKHFICDLQKQSQCTITNAVLLLTHGFEVPIH